MKCKAINVLIIGKHRIIKQVRSLVFFKKECDLKGNRRLLTLNYRKTDRAKTLPGTKLVRLCISILKKSGI